jgi:hypothetical protein
MERGIEVFAAINLLAAGLSHAFAPTAWKEFFTVLHAKGLAGSIFNALLALGMGSLIVAFHPVYDRPVPALLTIYGWASVAKGSVFLVFPALGLKSIETPTRKGPRLFIVPGVLMATLGAALLVYPWF